MVPASNHFLHWISKMWRTFFVAFTLAFFSVGVAEEPKPNLEPAAAPGIAEEFVIPVGKDAEPTNPKSALHLRLEDKFLVDSRKDYQLSDSVEWSKGKLTLPSQSTIAKSVECGPRAKLLLELLPADGLREKEPQEFHVIFTPAATESFGWSNIAAGVPVKVTVRRQQLEAGKVKLSLNIDAPLSARLASSQWEYRVNLERSHSIECANEALELEFEYRHGVVILSYGGEPILYGCTDNGHANIHAISVRQVAGRSELSQFKVWTSPVPELPPFLKRLKLVEAIAADVSGNASLPAGRYLEAEHHFRRALEICQDVVGKDHEYSLNSLSKMADSVRLQERSQVAHSLLMESLVRHRSVVGDIHPSVAVRYHNLALNLDSQGRQSESQSLARHALELSRKLYGERHPNVVAAYNFLASNLMDQGRNTEAQFVFQKALALALDLFGEKHPHTILIYNNLAASFSHEKRHDRAQPLFERAVRLHRALKGERHPETAVCYHNLAGCLIAQDKYSEALHALDAALEIYQSLPGKKHHGIVICYLLQAEALSAQNRITESESLIRKAAELSRDLQDANHLMTAGCYQRLGENLISQEKYEEAREVFREGLKITRAELGEHHSYTFKAYNNLGLALRHTGEFAEAQPLLQRALEREREFHGDSHPEMSGNYLNLGINLFAQKKYEEAKAILDRGAKTYEAARINASQRPLDRAVMGSTLSPYPVLAVTEIMLEAPGLAWAAAEANLARGLNDESALSRGATFTAEERARLGLLNDRLAQIQQGIFQLVSKKTLSEAESRELLLLRKQRAEQETELAKISADLSRRELTPLATVQAAIPQDAAFVLWIDLSLPGFMEEHWGCVVRDVGEPHWERLPGTGRDGKWTREDSELSTDLWEGLKSATSESSTVAVLAKRLGEQRLSPLAGHLRGVKRLFVVPVNLMAAVPMEAITSDFTISYVPSGSFLARTKVKSEFQNSRMLAIGDPIFDTPGEKRSADPDLPSGGLLILQVLPDGAAAKTQLKAGDVIVRYGDREVKGIESLTAAQQALAKEKEILLTVWREGLDKPLMQAVPPGKLGVALSNEPARDAILNRRKSAEMLASARDGDWKELPGSRAEVHRIQELFGSQATSLLDGRASEQALEELRKRGELSKFRYLHVATHGEAKGPRAFESVIILSQDSLPPAEVPRQDEPFINGQLAAREVLEFWKLDAELVTLSACKSALGRTGGGDGLLGFAQAFLAAGARSVCLSLWDVNDTATALLMNRFYQNLLGKRPGLDKRLGKAEALAEAKAWLRELSWDEVARLTEAITKDVDRRTRGKDEVLKLVLPTNDPKKPEAKDAKPFSHPRYWSAFVLIGDPH